MDERLKKALDFSNYRIALFNRKEDLKVQMDTMLTYAQNGGIFKITPELMTFVKMLVDMQKTRAIIIDTNGNPIEIKNVSEFFDTIFTRYWEATNVYYREYNKLKLARVVKSVYDFADE
jgi:uncharacterized protein YqkB